MTFIENLYKAVSSFKRTINDTARTTIFSENMVDDFITLKIHQVGTVKNASSIFKEL